LIIATTACGDGFCGGFHGYDPQQVKLTWMSTEHNVDVHAAARWLFSLTGEQKYAGGGAAGSGLLDRYLSRRSFPARHQAGRPPCG